MTTGTESTPSQPQLSMASRPEELPPVTPPSAGFIVQLFLIPALIVMAVVAVWALFGKLAGSESDWTKLTADISSNNELRRWPAAEQMAQLLRNEQITPPKDRVPLAKQPVVAETLTKLFLESLASSSTSDETIVQQEFLARTLGALDADDKTLPVLGWKDVLQTLRKRGFYATRQTGSHIIIENGKGLWTSIPRKNELGKGLVLQIPAMVA